MNRLFVIGTLVFLFSFGALASSAQCDPSTGQIKCSYYNEGYTDGAADANRNMSSDYRRYRSKYNSQYESYYRDGYNSGYNSVGGGGSRWSDSQRRAYDSGYSLGYDDRRRSSQQGMAGRGGGYDSNIALYFQQGYNDGYGNVPRRYNFPVDNNNPTYPPYPGGGTTGTAYWNGRVDDRANIIIRGNNIYAENAGGNGTQTYNQSMNGSLPRRATITARKADGRGSVTVIQQPNGSNNYTAIVQVYDSKNGAGDYRVEISWVGQGHVEEPYSSGNVRWRGRVDQNAQIIIYGRDVQSKDQSGSGLSGVWFDINGSLAGRPGSVNARRTRGRGTVSVVQQPNASNDFTAIVQVFDPKSGADDYEVEISW